MAIIRRSTLRDFLFRNGARPDEGDFASLFDSFIHQSEDGLHIDSSLNLGVGIEPATRLHINGGIKIGDVPEEDPEIVSEGTIRWTGLELQIFAGGKWETIWPKASVCKALMVQNKKFSEDRRESEGQTQEFPVAFLPTSPQPSLLVRVEYVVSELVGFGSSFSKFRLTLKPYERVLEDIVGGPTSPIVGEIIVDPPQSINIGDKLEVSVRNHDNTQTSGSSGFVDSIVFCYIPNAEA